MDSLEVQQTTSGVCLSSLRDPVILGNGIQGFSRMQTLALRPCHRPQGPVLWRRWGHEKLQGKILLLCTYVLLTFLYDDAIWKT